MTALTWLPFTFLGFLTHLARSVVIHTQPEKAVGKTDKFYERLGADVDTLAVAADFKSRERSSPPSLPDHAAHGADVLKKWSADRRKVEPVINASEIGAELGNYALQLRDKERLKAAAAAHAVMHETSVAATEDSGSDAASSSATMAMAASGGDLLKEWSSSHRAAAKPAAPPPVSIPVAARRKEAVRPTTSEHSTDKKPSSVAKVVIESPKAQAFRKAHSAMRDLEQDAAVQAADMAEDQPSTAQVASGDDLLANWAKQHDTTKDSVHHEMQAPQAEETHIAEPRAESHVSSIRADLESLRASAHDLEAKGDKDESAVSVEHDRQELKQAAHDMASKASRFHLAMHRLEDGSMDSETVDNSGSSSQAGSVGVVTGDEELQQWSKMQAAKHAAQKDAEDRKKRLAKVAETFASEDAAPSRSVTNTVSDDVATMRTSMQILKRSRLHDAMHGITSDVPDAAVSDSSAGVSETTREAGADTLEQWSKDHSAKPQKKFFMPRPAPVQIDRPVNQHQQMKTSLEAAVEEPLASQTQKWHDSSAHSAMRSLSADVPDSEAMASDNQQGLQAQQAGADTLEEWQKAHQPKRKPFLMKREALLSPSSAAAKPLEVESPASVKPADDVEKLASSISKWQASSLHDAMHRVGNDVSDADVDSDQTAGASESKSLTTSGEATLDAWTQAQSKPKSMKFFVAREPTQQAPRAAEQVIEKGPEPITPDAPSMDDIARKWHESALHSKMRSIGGDVSDDDVADSKPRLSVDSMSEAGADVLDTWSKAHAPVQKPRFFVPRAAPIALPSQTSAATTHDSDDSQKRSDSQDVQLSAKKIHETAVHEAMHSMASDVSDDDVKQVHAESAANEVGHDLIEDWSKSHPATEEAQPKHQKLMIDMYPPTAAPETDMLAEATARGFAKKAELELQPPVSNGAKLHKAMQSIGDVVLPTDEPSSHDLSAPSSEATAGADLLSQWSKTHDDSQVQKTAQEPTAPQTTEASAVVKDDTADKAHGILDSIKELHASTIHEAMHQSISDTTAKEQTSEVHQTVKDASEDETRNQPERPKRIMVDMYPPTAAPDTDMLAIAMSRGFGKKVEVALKAPVDQAGQLHASMQSMASAGMSDLTSSHKKAPSQADASSGADILSQWSQTHPASKL